MTSHVEEQIAARIAAVKAKTQQQREDRLPFAERRAAGLERRKTAKQRRVYCGTCARVQRKGSYLLCPLGCGQAVCRARGGCGNTHLRQCPSRRDVPTTETVSLTVSVKDSASSADDGEAL